MGGFRAVASALRFGLVGGPEAAILQSLSRIVNRLQCLVWPVLLAACGVPEFNFDGTGGTAGTAGMGGASGGGGDAGATSGGGAGKGGSGAGGSAGAAGTGGAPATTGPFTYETFDVQQGPLQGKGFGDGWSGQWTASGGVENDPAVTDLTPLTYAMLASSGPYAQGTQSTVVGRKIDISTVSTNVWYPYIFSSLIGKAGKEVWVSVLLRRSATDMSESAIVLHSNVSDPSDVGAPHVSLGYFGGEKFWSLRLGPSAVHLSEKAITVEPALLIAHITFAAVTSTVDFFVDPALDAEPETADVTASTGDAKFGSVALSLGTGAAVDEIRLGPTFASVTPAP